MADPDRPPNNLPHIRIGVRIGAIEERQGRRICDLAQGGRAVVGGPKLGGSIETVLNPIDLAIEKGASTVLMPVSCRRLLVDLSDEAAAKVQIVFYLGPADALRKALHDG